MPRLHPRIRIITEFLQDLCLNIGERPTGSVNNLKAQEYIGRIFERQGYQVEYQEFDCMDWRAGSISLRAGDQSLPAYISPYSLPCDVSAQYELISSVDQLDSAGEMLDKVAILHGELTREALMPKNFRFWNPEAHQRIIRLLEQKRPRAVITISKETRPAQPLPIIEDGDFHIPCAMLTEQAAQPLLSRTANLLELKIESSRQSVRAANVIARCDSGGKKIVLSAHLDTKPGTPGALDNASGVATLLFLGELMQYKHDQYTLEFVCFNGEDHYSNAGELAYLDRTQKDFPDIFFAANYDGVGYRQDKMGLSFHTCPAGLVALCERLRREHDLIEVIEPWPQGDHMLFVMKGVPTITFTSVEAMQLVDSVIHTENDVLDLLDGHAILEVAEFTKRLIVESQPLKAEIDRLHI